MIPDEDGGAGRVQVVVWVVDREGYAGSVPHDEFEASGCRPLGYAAIAYEAEQDGDEDAVGGAEEEGEVGCEEAGEEAGFGDVEVGEEEEEHGEAEEEGGGEEEVVVKERRERHFGDCLVSQLYILFETLSGREESSHVRMEGKRGMKRRC